MLLIYIIVNSFGIDFKLHSTSIKAHYANDYPYILNCEIFSVGSVDIMLTKVYRQYSIPMLFKGDNELNKFNFEKMSVEFTYDNALVFAIKNNNNKYLLQYFVNYNANAEDDVEVIFSNLSKNSNNFTEVKLEQVKSLLEQEIYSEVIV